MLLLLVCCGMVLGGRALASPYHYAQVIRGIDAHHTMISDAVKAPSGMIWVVGGGVLHRYDGVNVTPFSRLYGAALPFDEVVAIQADPWGRLWIDTRNGLFIFDTQTWSFIDRQHANPIGELAGEALIAFYSDATNLYIADDTGAVWRIGESAKELLFHFQPTGINRRKPVGKMLAADEDNVWLAIDGRLYGYDLRARRHEEATFPSGLFDQLEDVLPVKGGVLLRIYSQGYFVFTGGQFRYLSRPDFPSSDFTTWNHWSFAREDKVVVFHQDTYLEFTRDTAFQLLTTSTHNLAENILYKRINGWQYGHNEWLLATDHGLFSVFPARIAFSFMGARSARGMVKQRDNYYFGGYGYLNTWSEHTIFMPYTAAPENNYYAFLPLSADTTVIAMEGDFLNYLINGRVSRAPVHVRDTLGARFNGMAYSLVRQSADTLLVGTSNGIWRYAISSGQATPLTCPSNGFFSRRMRVQSIALQAGGISYTTNDGFYSWKNGTFRKIYPAGDTRLNIYTHVYRDGSVYLGTRGRGLVVLDTAFTESRAIRTEDGIASNTIYNMEWVAGTLFMGTHSGMSVYRDGQFFNYYSADGLPFEEFNHQAIYYDDAADRLFMGGIGGYTYFHPKQLFDPATAFDVNPVLSAIRMGLKTNRYLDDYQGLQHRDTLHLPADVVWLSMDFARPNFYRQAYRMQFKISPLMDEYQEMPASSQINLTGLSAGNYHVSVRIQTLNADQPEITRTWLINKKPVFTETLAFFALLSIGISGILAFFLYERSRRTKNEYRLRGKISRDLHDEVGGLLTGISMQADLLRLRAEEQPAVGAIGEHSRQATQMMDDIIWAVDARNNDQESLVDRMKYVARQLLEPREIEIVFELDQGERKIAQTVRQNLYLIFKEAIHNILKHSNATSVRIGLYFTVGSIVLYVQDNGTKTESQQVLRKGNGVRNLQLRASQIGAHLQCGFTGAGYEVRVTAPNSRGMFGWVKF